MLTRLGDKWFRVRHAAMARNAGDGVGRLVVAELREVFSVEVVGHFDHQARLVLDRVGVGGEVVAPGLRVSGVTERTVDAEVALILMHDFDDFVSGDVFGKGLDVGGIRTRSSGRARRRGLGWGSLGSGFLSQSNVGR